MLIYWLLENMLTFWTITGIVIYIIGIIIYVTGEIITNVKFHDGGFLGMGYSTNDNRDVTPSDVRKGLLWPLMLVYFMVRVPIAVLNDLIYGFLLIFNIEYNKTRLYKVIDKWGFK